MSPNFTGNYVLYAMHSDPKASLREKSEVEQKDSHREMSEVRSRKSEAGSRKPEVRSWKKLRLWFV
ncbi:MAG: hypothetical protein HXX13_17935 [Bacteroidetes bacterium]|nr:hypothetical protein [Bacteroidota bacterium]